MRGDAAPHLSLPIVGDPARFEPTVETLVRWGLTCDLDPIAVRAAWADDPAIREHWATVCASRALCDAISSYDDRQAARYTQRAPSMPLESDLGETGLALVESFVGDAAEARAAVALYSAEAQDLLWGLGLDERDAPNPESGLELLRLIRGSRPVTEAAEYIGSRIPRIER